MAKFAEKKYMKSFKGMSMSVSQSTVVDEPMRKPWNEGSY